MRRITLIAALLFLFACGGAARGRADELPQLLRVRQKNVEEKVKKNIYIRRMYPDSANEAVNEEIRVVVDWMTEKNRGILPQQADTNAYLETGAVITRTGTCWMSFLTLCEAAYAHELMSVEFDARVYDMGTGERVLLTDVFEPESEAWDVLAGAVREQLSAAFPGEEPDEEALLRLCQRENLQNAAFTLSVSRLTLTYRADEVYPGKNTLLHVQVYYPDIRPMMTPRAWAQTENRHFKLIALTFDDGNVMGRSRRLLEQLRRYGAQATYFIVGRTMRNNHDMLSRLQNGGYSVQSHTYTHRYPNEITPEEAMEDRLRFEEELASITGVAPTLMRSPGGMDTFYVRNRFDYPLIHWSIAGGDSGGTRQGAVEEAVLKQARDGAVVLLHETNDAVPEYTATILKELSDEGFLFVTVEELFAARGVELEPNRVYFSPSDVRDP